jgi:hypothetical protein
VRHGVYQTAGAQGFKHNTQRKKAPELHRLSVAFPEREKHYALPSGARHAAE